jgi:hypothetical protein
VKSGTNDTDVFTHEYLTVSNTAKRMEDDIWHKIRAEKDSMTSVRMVFLAHKFRFTLDLDSRRFAEKRKGVNIKYILIMILIKIGNFEQYFSDCTQKNSVTVYSVFLE